MPTSGPALSKDRLTHHRNPSKVQGFAQAGGGEGWSRRGVIVLPWSPGTNALTISVIRKGPFRAVAKFGAGIALIQRGRRTGERSDKVWCFGGKTLLTSGGRASTIQTMSSRNKPKMRTELCWSTSQSCSLKENYGSSFLKSLIVSRGKEVRRN